MRALTGRSSVRLMLDLQEKLGTLLFLGCGGVDDSLNILLDGHEYETAHRKKRRPR